MRESDGIWQCQLIEPTDRQAGIYRWKLSHQTINIWRTQENTHTHTHTTRRHAEVPKEVSCECLRNTFNKDLWNYFLHMLPSFPEEIKSLQMNIQTWRRPLKTFMSELRSRQRWQLKEKFWLAEGKKMPSFTLTLTGVTQWMQAALLAGVQDGL